MKHSIAWVCVCIHLLRTELMRAGHEVCAEQREADGVSALGGKLQALLKHFLKCTAVEAVKKQTQEALRRRDTLQITPG